MNKLMKNKKKKGFTLVELIAVIAIIGILAAIIVPMVGKYTRNANVSKAKEEMRQFVMAVETASADTQVAITDATPRDMDISAEPGKSANKIVEFGGLKMIQDVTFSDCKAVINGDSFVTVTKVDGESVATVSTTKPEEE